MFIMLLKGIAIGLIFGVPAGAVGAMTVQRTMSKGYKAGLVTGLGSSAADCIYACIGAFGLTLISDFLLKYQTVINILGGALILCMGIRMLLHKAEAKSEGDTGTGGAKLFLSSFAVGITNPAAILTFLFAFSWFGISGGMQIPEAVLLVLGVFIGTYCWWGTLTAITVFIKKKAKGRSFLHLNRLFGIVMILFATVIFIRLFL